MSWDVFIAFHQAHVAKAVALRAALEQRRIRAFVADLDTEVGLWAPQHAAVLHEAKLVIALVSPGALLSAHFLGETQSAAKGGRLLPVVVDASCGPEDPRWPPYLRAHDAVRTWDLDRVTRRVEAHIRPRPATSSATIPEELRDTIAAWLDDELPGPKHRRLAVTAAGLEVDGSQPWAMFVAGLSPHQLERLLREAGDDDEIAAFVEALGALSQPVGFEDLFASHLEAELQARIEHGTQHLRGERYEEAADAFRQVEDRATALLTTDRPVFEQLLHRARLNRVAALSGAGWWSESTELLKRVDRAWLPERGRLNLGRFLALADEPEAALAAVDGLCGLGAEVVRQLVQVREGAIPEALVDDPDVQLQAAVLCLRDANAPRAADLALAASTHPGLNDHGRQQVARVLGAALHSGWIGMSEPVGAPAAVLAKMRALVQAGAWPEVERLRRMCELDDVEEDDATGRVLPAWVDPLVLALNSDAPLEQTEEVARTWPVAAVDYHLAQVRLEHGRVQEAVDAAERAVSVLPGRGQRLLLARALAAAGRIEDLRRQLDHLDPRADVWPLRMQAALAGRHSQLVLEAEAYAAAFPALAGPWTWLAYARLEAGEVDAARQEAYRALDADTTHLSLDGLRVLAAAATAGSSLERVLARRCVAVLHERFSRDADAEAVRAQLLLALDEGSSDEPIDWQLLQDAGLVERVSTEQALAMIREAQELHRLLDRTYAAGALAFESWAPLRNLAPGIAAHAIRRGELAVAPPVPPRGEASPWRGHRCLVGGLGLEVLVALDLHVAFGDAVSELVVLADTYERVVNGALASATIPWTHELERTAARWRPFEHLPEIDTSELGSDGAVLDSDDVKSLVAWLGEAGRAPRTDQAPWKPPVGPVVIRGTLLYQLHTQELSEAFLAECRAQDLQVAVDVRAKHARELRRRELEHRIAAIELASEQHRWLGSLHATGRLRILPVPTGPDLPSLRSGEEDPPWVTRAFALREAMLTDPELVLVSAELPDLGLRGLDPWLLLDGRAWPPGQVPLRDRYQALADRCITIAGVARDLVAPPQRADVLGMLAIAGYVDAYDSADVVALFDTYGSLPGVVPHERLLGLVRSMARERQPHDLLLALVVGLILAPRVVTDAWFGDAPRSDAEELTLAMLEVVEDMDRATRGRLRLLDLCMEGVTDLSAAHPLHFLEVQGDHATLADDKQGVRLWQAIGRWVSRRPERRNAMDLGVAAAYRGRTISRLGEIGASIAGVVLASLPGGRGPIPVTGHTLAHAFNTGDDGFLEQLEVNGRTLKQWQSEAVAAARSGVRIDGVELEIEVGPHTVRLALEGACRDLERLQLEEIAHLIRSDDGALSTALRGWSSSRTEEYLAALQVAFARSPVRAVRSDPRVITTWAQWTCTGASAGPRSVAELQALLDEPTEDFGRPVDDRLHTRLNEGGSWHDVYYRDLLEQLARMPGVSSRLPLAPEPPSIPARLT